MLILIKLCCCIVRSRSVFWGRRCVAVGSSKNAPRPSRQLVVQIQHSIQLLTLYVGHELLQLFHSSEAAVRLAALG